LAGHRANISSVVFSPSDRWLASASTDATVLIWDVGEMLRTPIAAVSSPFDLERSWSDLVAEDASKAYRAIWDLALAPDRSIPFLSERLKPIGADDLQKGTSLSSIVSGETLRRVRAMAVLEIARTPEARCLLKRLAAGLESARETREARESLRRLGPM
jgi:WD40 repeat protein